MALETKASEHGWFYQYPLSEEDFKKLLKGQLVLRNFSPPLQPDKLICIVAWNKSILGSLDKKQFDAMRKGGISVANIPLTKENLDYIKQGNGIEVKFPICRVLIGMVETFRKAEAENKAKKQANEKVAA